MKKVIALLMALAMVLSLAACGGSKTEAPAAESSAAASAPAAGTWGSELHWDEYDKLITDIRTTADTAQRAEMMHEAEDKLMDTWCIAPIYYYNDQYMLKDYVQGMFSNAYGFKYFYNMEMTNGAKAFNANLASEPDHLDPALNSSVDGACLAVNSFEGLMTYDENGQLVPAQAESYEVSEDGTTYTFTMRDGLKWSNGDDLTAKDFEYSWRRFADATNAADYAYLCEVFADAQYDADGNFIGLGEGSVETSEDGKTITAHLNCACPYFLDLCAFPAFYPVHQATVEATATADVPTGTWANDAGDNFVCNGAYMLKAWNHDKDMTYVKNPNYRNADSVKIDTINYMLTAQDTVAFNAYQSGDLDMIDSIPNDELGKLLQENAPELHIIDNLGTYYVGFNYNSKLYSDLGLDEEQAKVFRHALCLLIDRQYIVDNIALCGQKLANSFVPLGTMDGNGGEFKSKDYFSVDDYEANVEEAKSLLESIGLWDGTQLTQPISFEYLTNEGDAHVKIAQALQQDWGQIGIDVSIQTEEWNVFLNDRKNGNYDVARNGWLMDYNDPINMLEMWATSSGNNDCQLGRPAGF